MPQPCEVAHVGPALLGERNLVCTNSSVVTHLSTTTKGLADRSLYRGTIHAIATSVSIQALIEQPKPALKANFNQPRLHVITAFAGTSLDNGVYAE